jgi:hypothetical protein
MTRWMNGGEIERLAMLTNRECAQFRSGTPKSRPVSAKTESGETVSIFIPEGWLDRTPGGLSASQLVVISPRGAQAR